MSQVRDPATAGSRRIRTWQIVWLVAALAYAVPVTYLAYNRLIDVNRHARENLILQHRLWELNPEYRGNGQNWTRFAARLLTDNQLMRRVRSKYGELATDIELDYYRDLSIAQGEVAFVALGAWALPAGALYLAAFLATRRRRAAAGPSIAPEEPARSDARYRP